MRFFESLAAEASLNKQMGDPSVTEPLATEPPPPEPVRRANETIDLLTGNDVLDLPDLGPVPQPQQVEDVLDLGIPAAPAREETLEFAPVVTTPAEAPEPPARTQALASAPPERPVPPAAPEPAEPPSAPRPRPTPTPIPLPSQYHDADPGAAAAPAVEEPAEPRADPVRFRPQRITPTPAPTPPHPVPAPAPPPPPAAAAELPAPARQSPAEFATANTSAWVAPEVERRPRSSGSRLGLLALVALLVVSVSGYLLWRFLVRDLVAPKAPVAQGPTAPAPAPPQTKPAPDPQPAQPSPAPAPTTPAPTAPAPTGSGGFTVQVRSSPSEADARAFADSLRAAGFEAYVVRADLGARGTWYRVRVGRFDSRDEARQAAGKLRSSGRASDALIQAYEAP